MKKYNTIKVEVRNFLKRNGFNRIETNHYANEYCGVVFCERDIAIADNCGREHFVPYDDNSLFSVIGILSWRGFIEMRYVR